MVSIGGGSSSTQQGPWSGQSPYLKSLYEGLFGLANWQSGGGLPTGAAAGQPQNPSLGTGNASWYTGGNYQTPGGGGIPSFPPGGTFGGTPSGNPTTQPVSGRPQAQMIGVPGTGQGQQPPFGAIPWGGTNPPGGAGNAPGAYNPWGPYASASANLSSGLLSGQNPWVSGQVSNLGQDIGNFYNQQILPGINQQASFYGGTGGSRQGIAQGLAGQGALQAFQHGANDIYANSLQNAGQLYNLGMQPFNAQWAPFQNYANLLGNPMSVTSGSGWNANAGFTGLP